MKLSELRQDIVSGDWILIASARGARPHAPGGGEKRVRARIPGCPFENPGGEPLLEYRKRGDWSVRVVENKFPAFTHPGTCSEAFTHGLYTIRGGVGHHDLVITRDHDRDFTDLTKDAAEEVFRAFRDRYIMLTGDTCLVYVSMFHNWGPNAGASIYHPHYQMIAIPVIPPNVEHSLEGSRRYFKKHGACVHCAIIAWEKKEKKRIIYENKDAIVLAPFASRNSFEFRLFPKRHEPFFENTVDARLAGIADALRVSLRSMRKALKDPDYNFFIHTSPLQKKRMYNGYHWHIEVLPKVNIAAGFELGTGIDINPVDPDEAAKMLRPHG